MNKKIRIGCRGSKLSLAYTSKVQRLISRACKYKIAHLPVSRIKTSGDIFKNKKISSIGGKNLFCREIEKSLIKKKIDLAIHSLKDLDSFETKGLIIKAYIKRNDPRETFVSKKFKNFSNLRLLKIGSSSRRRKLQAKILNKNIYLKNIRGNIDTRIKKINEGYYDGAILALAGVKTLKLNKYVKEIFPIQKFLPNAGQGIIAVQCRKNDKKMIDILRRINHKKTEICALTERSFLKTIGGDCDTAVGCFAKIYRKKIEY